MSKMQTIVNGLKIVDKKTNLEAANILSGIKSVSKEIDAKKKEITAPMNEALKATRALFSPMELQLKEAEQGVKTAMLAYHKEEETKRLAEEERLAKRVDKGTMKMDTAVKKLEETPEVDSHMETDTGSATIRKIKKFKVVDMKKLPMEYHLANETVIRMEMNNGKELPGVEYWEEDNISAR